MRPAEPGEEERSVNAPRTFDNEKPSRQNRRQKRGWKRQPKNALDHHLSRAYIPSRCSDLQHEIGISYTRRTTASSGFFTSVARLLFLGGCVGHLRMRRNLVPVCQPAQSPSLIGIGKGGSKPLTRSRSMQTQPPPASPCTSIVRYAVSSGHASPGAALRLSPVRRPEP